MIWIWLLFCVFSLRISGLICLFILMCTSPIQISRRNPLTGQTRVDVVPCGKCEECRSFKRQEFAALSIHQAMVSGSLYFFTLTYNDAHLPVAFHDRQNLLGFESVSCREIPVSWWNISGNSGLHFENRVVEHDGLLYTPSLRREDVKNWIKRFRVEYERKFKEKPSFKYCFFGELGEHYGRPHYHGLVYGCSAAAARMLHDLWCDRFGFAYCVPSDYRSLDITEIGKVSNYVSKYISKGVHSRFSYLLPYIEKPRRICSQDFGSFSPEEYKKLRNYYDGADLKHLSRELFFDEVLKRRSSYKINGCSFPIPLKLKQKLFYEDGRSVASRDGADGTRKSCKDFSFKQATKSSVSCMVSSFARSKHTDMLDEQLRKNPRKDSLEANRRIIREALRFEESSLQSREEIAKENHINNLKTQKDGQ